VSWWQTLVVAVCLGLDAFSVALSVGHTGTGVRSAFRLSFHFGLFQFLMPVVGWLLGAQLAGRVQGIDHWVAFGILAVVGVNMVWGALGASPERAARDHSRGWTLVGLSLTVSFAARGGGVGRGILGMSLLRSAAVIGVVAGVMTLAGANLSRRIAAVFGRRAEAVGGVVLIGLAVSMLGL
jgi:putative Mn2+ efflux pump MntP